VIAAFDWSSAVSALVGAAIGGLATIGAVLVTQGREKDRDRLNDERRIRDAKAVRLRSSYAGLISAALNAERLANEMLITRTVDGDAAPSPVIDEEFRKAVEMVVESTAQVILDDEGQQARDISDGVWRDFVRFRNGLAYRSGRPTPRRRVRIHEGWHRDFGSRRKTAPARVGTSALRL
jgi:hypothetical protein